MAEPHWIHWVDLWKDDAERGVPPHSIVGSVEQQLAQLREHKTLIATRSPYTIFNSVVCSSLAIWRVYTAMEDSVVPHSVFRQYVQTSAAAVFTATLKHTFKQAPDASAFTATQEVLDEIKQNPALAERVAPVLHVSLDPETLSIGYFIAHAEGRAFAKDFREALSSFDDLPLGKAAVEWHNRLTADKGVREKLYEFFHARKNFSGVQRLPDQPVTLRNVTAQQLLSSIGRLAVCVEEMRNNSCVNRLPPSPTVEFGVVPSELKLFGDTVTDLTTAECVAERKQYSIPSTGPWLEQHLDDGGPLEPLMDPSRASSLLHMLKERGADPETVTFVKHRTEVVHQASCMVSFSVLPPTMVLEHGHYHALVLLLWPFIGHKVVKWSPFLRWVPGSIVTASDADWAHFAAFALLMHYKYSNFCRVPGPQLYIAYGLNRRMWLPVEHAEEILSHLELGVHVQDIANVLVAHKLLSQTQSNALVSMLTVTKDAWSPRLSPVQSTRLRQAAQDLFFAHVARTGSHGEEVAMEKAMRALDPKGHDASTAEIAEAYAEAHKPLFNAVEPTVLVRHPHGPSTDEIHGEAHPTAPDPPIGHLGGGATNTRLHHVADTVLRDRKSHGDRESASLAVRFLGERAQHRSDHAASGHIVALPGAVFHGPVEFHGIAEVSCVVLGLMSKEDIGTDAWNAIAGFVRELHT